MRICRWHKFGRQSMPNGCVEILDRVVEQRYRDHGGCDVATIPATHDPGEPDAGLLAAGNISAGHLPQSRPDHTVLEVLQAYSVGALGLFAYVGGLYFWVSFVHYNDPAKCPQ
jgi:hypothetical protein